MDNLGGSAVEGPSTSEPESGGGLSHGPEPRVRGPEGQTVELDNSAIGRPPDDHGLSEDQRSRAVGGYIAGNPDIVTTGADDPTQGPYTREDITVRQNGAGDLVVGPSEVARERVRQDRYESFAEGVAYSDRAMFDEARAKSSYSEGVTYSDRDLVGAADDAARDSHAEGVVFSDLDLYREEIRSRIEEAGGDPDDYRVSVKSTDVGFAVSADLVRDPSAGPVARWARGVTGDPLGGYRDDVFGRRERIEGRRREAVDELGDALVTTDARVREGTGALEDAGRSIGLRTDRDELLGAAAIATASPEPVSSAAGLAVSGLIGAAVVADWAVDEFDVDPEDLSGRSEMEVPAEERTAEVPVGPTLPDSEVDAGPTMPASEVGVPSGEAADPATIRTSELVQPERRDRFGEETPDELLIGDEIGYIRDGDDIVLIGERDSTFHQDREFFTGGGAVVGREAAEGDVAEGAEETAEPAESVDIGLGTGGLAQTPGVGTGQPSRVRLGDRLEAPRAQMPRFEQPPWLSTPSMAQPQAATTPTSVDYPTGTPSAQEPVGEPPVGFGTPPSTPPRRRPRPDAASRADEWLGFDGAGGGAMGDDESLAVGWLGETFGGFAGVDFGPPARRTPRADLKAQETGQPFGEFLPTFTAEEQDRFEGTLAFFGLDWVDGDGGWV